LRDIAIKRSHFYSHVLIRKINSKVKSNNIL
jgi:hypothetical protein